MPALTNATKKVQIFQHHKGGLYKFISWGKQESSQNVCAIYESVETGEVWIRPKKEFIEKFKKYEAGNE